MMNNRILTEEQQFYRRLNHGDTIWRPATLHADSGLMPHDIDVREQPPINIGKQVVFGFVAYAISGDLEHLGVLPNVYDFQARDKALRFCSSWMENDRKPGEYLGMRVFLPDEPPPCWTHATIERVQRVTVDESTNKGYYCYYGRWESSPELFAHRYLSAYVADMRRHSNGRRMSDNPKIMSRIADMHNLEKVCENLGIDRVFLKNTPANTTTQAPTETQAEAPVADAGDVTS